MKEDNKPLMTFGKYKGRKIEWVALTDINYAKWAYENVDYFKETVNSHSELKDDICNSPVYTPVFNKRGIDTRFSAGVVGNPIDSFYISSGFIDHNDFGNR